ncbi:MAG: class I SAM-dependent methyltransferase [Acidobacteriaceae bacterium]
MYASTPDERLSWFEADPQLSFGLIQREGLPSDARILDVGAGTSRLPGMLAEARYRNVSVLDISGEALRSSKERLGDRSALLQWIEADVLSWTALSSTAPFSTAHSSTGQELFHLWHDRATFHFLVAPDDRALYVRNATASLRVGGIVLLTTFAPEGPQSCSGLPVYRADAETIAATFAPSFLLLDSFTHTHRTPSGTPQLLQVCRLRRA